MEININGPCNNLGYGLSVYNIIVQLFKLGVKLRYYPIGQTENMPYSSYINRAIDNIISPNLKAPTIKIWHQNDLFASIGHGEHIGFPIFELDYFTALEVGSLTHCDRLFVCSDWAKKIVLDNVVKFYKRPELVSVIPLGVDNDIFKPKGSFRSNTIFFNCGKWEIRKGHDVLVEIFNEAFDYNDNVELWMMCDNPFLSVAATDKWKSLYTSSKLGSKIKFIPRQSTQKDVYNIMLQADIGIFPARAEGWNLELLEMMACGKHVITTNYSGHTQFCTEENSYLVNIDNKESAFDNIWFHGQGNWAQISEKQKSEFVTHMRNLHEAKKIDKLGLNYGGIKTAEKFSWRNTAEEIMNALQNTARNN